MNKIKLYWVQAALVLAMIIGQVIDRSVASKDLSVTLTLTIMLAVLSYLGKPSETVAEMREKILSGDSKVKKFLLTYLLPIYLVLLLLLSSVLPRF